VAKTSDLNQSTRLQGAKIFDHRVFAPERSVEPPLRYFFGHSRIAKQVLPSIGFRDADHPNGNSVCQFRSALPP
jgi:hypothetical protein